MHAHFPRLSLSDTKCAVLIAVVIAGGLIGIAVATLQTMLAFDAAPEVALMYRAGDNPWKYVWSGARDDGPSSTDTASVARTPEDVEGKSIAILARTRHERRDH